MQSYKALEDLGVKREDCYTNWFSTTEPDERTGAWRKQRELFGIDERSTWNWSDDYMDYIYIHLEMFNRVNIVDFDREYIRFKESEIPVQVAIDTVLNWFRTRYYPNKLDTININDYDTSTPEGREIWHNDLVEWCNEKQEILDLFAKIIPHLNW